MQQSLSVACRAPGASVLTLYQKFADSCQTSKDWMETLRGGVGGACL